METTWVTLTTRKQSGNVKVANSYLIKLEVFPWRPGVMGTVTAKLLKNRTGEVLRRVRQGETVTVTVRGVRVAQFVPVKDGPRAHAVREERRSKRAVVRSVAGKYQGVGTVEEFLVEKRREITLER